MVRISGADKAGLSGRADKAGSPQKNEASGAGKSPGTGNASGPSLPRPAQNAEKTPPLSAAGSPRAPKTLSGLVQSLGLPRDLLSASILSFARYFSLSLNPGLMAKIRRESLSVFPAETPRGKALSPQDRGAQTAAAFAAAAAAAKGLELSREGLAAYAAAIDPDYPEKHSGDSAENPQGGADPGQNSGGGDSGPENQKNGEGGGEPRGTFKGSPQGGSDPGDFIRPETLREKVLAIEGQNPLLDLLNRIPGKNGERWISLPFAFTRGDTEYRISLHISLAAPCSHTASCRLAMDISGGPRDKPMFRWFFIHDKFAGEEPRLRARFWPPENGRVLKSFQKELSRLFDIQINKINLQNNEEYASGEKNYGDDILPTINEEV